MTASLLLVLPVAVLLGASLVLAALGWPRTRAGWTGLGGNALLLGLLLGGLATYAVGVGSVPARAFFASLPWLAPLLLANLAVFLVRERSLRSAVAAGPLRSVGVRAWPPDPVWTLLLLLLGLHLVLALWQALLLPTVPWDAWTTWVGRARAWHAADSFAAFVTPAQWLAQEMPGARATLAPHYPTLLPRLLVWWNGAAGWSTPATHLLWPLLGLALSAILYGELRRAGAGARLAMAAAFACVSLPLLNAHLTLAGYADLWVATVLAAALLHAVHWRQGRGRGHLLLALLLGALLPLLKLEGAVWLVCLAVGLGWSLLPRRWRWVLPLALALALLALLAGATLVLPLPGLGRIALSQGAIEVPAIGRLALHWRPVLDEVAASLFAWRNWHLLWVVLPAVFAWRWRAIAGQPALLGAAVFLLLGYAFLFVLFFLTDASAWAENLTSINRLLLHVVPASIAVAVLALLPAQPARPSASTSS